MYNLKNLTIIIVTFLTRKKTLLNCLNSIDKNVKIVIIENSANFKNENLDQDVRLARSKINASS